MAVPRKIQCTVSKIIDHGSHVYTLILSSPVSLPVIKPGQFLHLAIDAYEPGDFWPESRIFSVARVDRDNNLLTLCYSVKGVFTSRMENSLSVGNPVWLKLPYGDFVIDPEEETVLIAGGTGISPFLQYLETDLKTQCMLVYGARNQKALLFKDEIDKTGIKNPGLKIYYFVEEGNEDPDVLDGRLDINWIIGQTINVKDPVYYLSGPPIMIKTFTKELLDNGIPARNIRTDAWE